jgi:hypothetical protein
MYMIMTPVWMARLGHLLVPGQGSDSAQNRFVVTFSEDDILPFLLISLNILLYRAYNLYIYSRLSRVQLLCFQEVQFQVSYLHWLEPGLAQLEICQVCTYIILTRWAGLAGFWPRWPLNRAGFWPSGPLSLRHWLLSYYLHTSLAEFWPSTPLWMVGWPILAGFC